MGAAAWRRLPGGYMRADGAWFLYRGAPMSHGGNAWLVHRRLPADSPRIGREDARFAYDTRDGSPLWTIDADGYADSAPTDTEAPIFAHEFDAGWLSEAKAAVEDTEAREAAAR